jgi:hypothetical protein
VLIQVSSVPPGAQATPGSIDNKADVPPLIVEEFKLEIDFLLSFNVLRSLFFMI